MAQLHLHPCLIRQWAVLPSPKMCFSLFSWAIAIPLHVQYIIIMKMSSNQLKSCWDFQTCRQLQENFLYNYVCRYDLCYAYNRRICIYNESTCSIKSNLSISYQPFGTCTCNYCMYMYMYMYVHVTTCMYMYMYTYVHVVICTWLMFFFFFCLFLSKTIKFNVHNYTCMYMYMIVSCACACTCTCT